MVAATNGRGQQGPHGSSCDVEDMVSYASFETPGISDHVRFWVHLKSPSQAEDADTFSASVEQK
ncbi:hypothetical protein F2Q69_00035994 [Brassica cretica]|uniref:Uncharacterized protein n=1 Tax=Brassica cretica TaxID=69181 RepID=A0A8S9SE38_BRACR|nr:hypothetical protein F2Q69_00035994 [Brassica cretica]